MSHPGTYVNAPTLGVTGLVPGDPNTAVSFDPASNQYVVQADTIDAQSFSAFTLGCIVKPTNSSDANSPAFWGIAGNGSDEIAFQQTNAGKFSFDGSAATGAGASNPFVISATSTVGGSVYRLIGTWDGTTGKLYVNGVLDASAAWAGPIDIETVQFFAATDQFDTTNNAQFDGTLDECFFVPNHAATTGEIATIDAAMTGTGNVVTAINALSPYIYWRLGESSGTVAEDSAGSGGTLYTPPVIYDEGPILPDTQGLPRLLFRHYPSRPRFQTVWKLATNPITYSLTQPYPLITPDDVRMGNVPIGQQYNTATYLHVYYGPETVDSAEAARLVASGIGTVT